MGKDAGFIALRTGIGCGAEAVLYPESDVYIDHLLVKLSNAKFRKKESSIVIVAEGAKEGGANEVARRVMEAYPELDVRVVVLGHVQRGGSPTCMERVRASQMGMEAVESLIAGKRDVMIGLVDKKIEFTPFDKAIKHTGEMTEKLLRLTEVMST